MAAIQQRRRGDGDKQHLFGRAQVLPIYAPYIPSIQITSETKTMIITVIFLEDLVLNARGGD